MLACGQTFYVYTFTIFLSTNALAQGCSTLERPVLQPLGPGLPAAARAPSSSASQP